MVSVVFCQNTCVIIIFKSLIFFKTFFPAFIYLALGYKLTLAYFGRSLNTNLIILKKILLVYANHPYFYWNFFCTNGIFCHIFSLSYFWADFRFSFSFSFLEKNSPHIHSGFGLSFNARSLSGCSQLTKF